LRKVYYESHGQHPGTPLLLLHGIGGSCRGWLPLQVPVLSRERRVLITDYRGAGESEDPGGPFAIADLADDAAGLLEALEVERADVVGSFMGGMVAQELALRHPQRVGQLVLVGTFARPDARRRMILRHWRDLALSDLPVLHKTRERLIWTLQDETLEQSDLIDGMLEHMASEMAPLSGELMARQCDACLAHDTYDRLREIPHRTLVLCGRHDILTPPKLHRELADEIPNAHLMTLSYGAHLVMAECAQQLNEAVLRFLAEAD
jgi:pimeloyl-ACP methyl ester carboxylesterase